MKLLRLAALLFVAASCGSPPAPETRSPNVVYILSDTHRWGAMSFTQTPAVQTPNLERLAREGVSFNRRYVNLPICTPDRAIFLTGRWPYQQGLIANHMALAHRVDLPDGERYRGTLAWAFKNAGYTTALFGEVAPRWERRVAWTRDNWHDPGKPERPPLWVRPLCRLVGDEQPSPVQIFRGRRGRRRMGRRFERHCDG